MHPDVIEFARSRLGLSVEYFHTIQNGEVVGAYPVVNNEMLGARIWQRYPVSYDETVIPLAPECRIMLPERSNRISPYQQFNFTNVNYTIARKNAICIVKNTFSTKTEKNRRNEYNRFIRAGGKCMDQSCFTNEELSDIYIALFKARFHDSIKCYDKNDILDIIKYLRHLVFGNVLFIDDQPCAFDLIFYGESERLLYFDVPNGGLDTRFSHLSPGSVLMWKNIQAARNVCGKKNRPMRFSIGALDKEWAYKLRWANSSITGKPFF